MSKPVMPNEPNMQKQLVMRRQLATHNKSTMPETSKVSPKFINQGFTLLELLVVMVIIGLLASYVGPKYFAQLGKSETKTAKAQIESLVKALDTYRLDTGHYPASEAGLAALNTAPNNEPKWQGPYLAKGVPLDPWGKPYQYRMPGEHGDVDVWSFGSDGNAGGTDAASDVVSWQ